MASSVNMGIEQTKSLLSPCMGGEACMHTDVCFYIFFNNNLFFHYFLRKMGIYVFIIEYNLETISIKPSVNLFLQQGRPFSSECGIDIIWNHTLNRMSRHLLSNSLSI